LPFAGRHDGWCGSTPRVPGTELSTAGRTRPRSLTPAGSSSSKTTRCWLNTGMPTDGCPGVRSRSCSTSHVARRGADSSSPRRTWCSTPRPANGRGDSPGSTCAAPARRGRRRGDYWQVRVSRDDGNLAVTAREPLLRSLDVLNVPSTARPRSALTTSVAADSDGVWSPDGRQLAFRSMKRGARKYSSSRRQSDQSTTARTARPRQTCAAEVPTDWRGSDLLLQQRGKGIDSGCARTQDRGGHTRCQRPVSMKPTSRWSPAVGGSRMCPTSPAGRTSMCKPSVAKRQRVSLAGGTHPRWTRDGRALLFLRGSTLMRSDLNAGAGRFEAAHPLFDAPGNPRFRTSPIAATVSSHSSPFEPSPSNRCQWC
jgi:hypothetical protein